MCIVLKEFTLILTGVSPGPQTLSGGAIAGIAVGVIVFLVIIILIRFSVCVVVFMRLRNKRIYSYRGYSIW